MTPEAIDVARKRKMESADDCTLENITHKKHHLFKDYEGKTLVFGDDLAV